MDATAGGFADGAPMSGGSNADERGPKAKAGSKVARVAKIVGIVLGCLVAALAVTVFALWHDELATFFSIQEIQPANAEHRDGAVYTMDVSGGYYFDEFLEQGGAKSDPELISYMTGHITKGLIGTQIEQSDIKCASFTAKTPEGARLFGRNYDFTMTNTCLVHTNPGGGRHESISTVDLQFIGVDPEVGLEGVMDKVSALAAPFVPLDGMNDAGLACGIYMTDQGGGEEADGSAVVVATDQNTNKPDLTSTTMLRMVLDYCTSVDEAVEMIRGYDLHDSANTSFHYMLADATGRSAILEWVAATDATDNDGSARQLVVTFNDDDAYVGEQEAAADDYQWVTNFIVGDPNYYANEDEMGGLDRYQHLGDVLSAAHGVLADDAAAMDLLSQISRRSWDPAHGKPDSRSVTVHSAVYNLTDKTVTWVPNEHYDDPSTYQVITLGE